MDDTAEVRQRLKDFLVEHFEAEESMAELLSRELADDPLLPAFLHTLFRSRIGFRLDWEGRVEGTQQRARLWYRGVKTTLLRRGIDPRSIGRELDDFHVRGVCDEGYIAHPLVHDPQEECVRHIAREVGDWDGQSFHTYETLCGLTDAAGGPFTPYFGRGGPMCPDCLDVDRLIIESKGLHQEECALE